MISALYSLHREIVLADEEQTGYNTVDYKQLSLSYGEFMNLFDVSVYYSRFPNFGDLLNEYILQSLYHIHVEHRLFTDAELVSIGSILDKLLDHGNITEYYKNMQKDALADKPIHVWGTGLMFPYQAEEQHFVRPLEVHAVRGDLTRRTVADILGKQVPCALGDPGILASYVLPAEEKQYDMGIIPHFVDAELPVIEKMQDHYPNSLIINVRADPETVLKQISSCRRTISTSLHGLVISDSYGIPNCWCEASDNVLGGGFKFHDYFSSFCTDREPFNLRDGSFPDDDSLYVTSFQTSSELRKQQKALIHSFPYSLLLKGFEKKIDHKIKKLIKNG